MLHMGIAIYGSCMGLSFYSFELSAAGIYVYISPGVNYVFPLFSFLFKITCQLIFIKETNCIDIMLRIYIFIYQVVSGN